MPLPQKWNRKRRAPPAGFDYVEPVLEALENELRDKVKESNLNKRKTESMWPVHQINWQKSRYIYDMYYTHHKISKQVYQYCLDQKLVDAALIAKWKKPGYERLCSTYVINPSNYKFGTTSICRVPWFDRSEDQKHAQDPVTGCLGCASGRRGAGPRNIFGNKYGQNLAAVQVAREKRLEARQQKQKLLEQEEERRRREEEQAVEEEEEEQGGGGGNDEESETDDDTDDDDDYGPSPAAGIWAGSQKLQQESEKIANPDDDDDGGEAETDDDDDDDDDQKEPPSKKVRADD